MREEKIFNDKIEKTFNTRRSSKKWKQYYMTTMIPLIITKYKFLV